MRLLHGVGRYVVPRPLALFGWVAAALGAFAGLLWTGDDFAQRYAAVLALMAAAGELILGVLAHRLRRVVTDSNYDNLRVLIARGRYALALLVGGGVLGAGVYGILDSSKIDDALKAASVYLAVLAALKVIHSEHYRLTTLEHEHGVQDRSLAIAWTDTVSSRVPLSAGVLAGAWLLVSPAPATLTVGLAVVIAIFAFAALRWNVEDDVEPPSVSEQSDRTVLRSP